MADSRALPTSGAAIASLVLGVLSLAIFWFPTIALVAAGLAIVLGIVGIRQGNAGTHSGRGLAIAGLVVGAVGLVFAGLIAANTVDSWGGESVELPTPSELPPPSG